MVPATFILIYFISDVRTSASTVHVKIGSVLRSSLSSKVELYSVADRQPMQLDQGRRDMVGATQAEHQSSSCILELCRCRFFKSVSVFVFLVGFFKSRYRFRFRFFKISRYRFRFSVFLHEPTIAYRITPSLTSYALPSPEWGLGPRICITNCGHKR